MAARPGPRPPVTPTPGDKPLAGGSFEESAEGLRIVTRRKGGISSWFGWSDGGVEIEVPSETDIDLDTPGGTVSCDLPITAQGGMSRSSLRGTIGSGGPRLTLRSSGGSILIGERSSEGV